jgi:hypothetical protein
MIVDGISDNEMLKVYIFYVIMVYEITIFNRRVHIGSFWSVFFLHFLLLCKFWIIL